MKAVITVIGDDKIGIIAGIATILSERNINILDIRQTISQEYFTMVMIVDLEKAKVSLKELRDTLGDAGKKIGVSITIQHEDIFNAMHKI